MAECKPTGLLLVGFHLKGKVGSQHEVTAETDNVSNRVGHRLIHIVYQQQVDGILDGNGYTANDTEAYEFYYFFTFYHCPDGYFLQN